MVCGIVCSLMTMSMAKATQSAGNSTLSNSKTLQAQSYAVGKIDLLRSTAYSDLKAEGKTAISGTDFFQEVTLSSESNYTDSIKQKTATVKVYKGQETIPRAELKLTRYTAEQKASGVPIGTVIAWPGTKNPTDGTWLEGRSWGCVYSSFAKDNGAFRFVYENWSSGVHNNDGFNSYWIYIDASRCSSVYGKSTTVQPPAVTVKYLIKAA